MANTSNNDKNKEVTLEASDPGALKPVRKQNALKKLLSQLQSTGSPPLEGEEVLPAKLIGDGNYHWYPLAWLRWLARWEQFKTVFLLVVLVALIGVFFVISKRTRVQVTLPQLAVEQLLRANKFNSMDQQHIEAYLCFAVQAANQMSVEGAPTLKLLEGSIDPSIMLMIQQRQKNEQTRGTPPAEFPIYTIYVSGFSRWGYNPAKREVNVVVKGFRTRNSLAGKSSIEPYRAVATVFMEPTSNRNRWGYYLSKFEEYYGNGADTIDAELQRHDRIGY